MSAATAFMEDLKNGPGMEPDEDVFKGIWEQYERVIIRSLITSFGLDFLVKDQHDKIDDSCLFEVLLKGFEEASDNIRFFVTCHFQCDIVECSQ